MPVVAENPWKYHQRSITSPPMGAVSITPSNSDELAVVIRAIEATGAGNVNVVFVDGTSAVLALAAGERKTGLIKQVMSTSTNATGLIGLY